jgi:outer membrane receptor for ferrienterochelin and colicins
VLANSKTRSPWWILGLVLAITSPLRAQEPSGQEASLDELSLEQLLEVVITSASKRAENINEAPSVMQVITSEDIRKLGANNLRDVFERATSVQTFGSTMIPENVVSIRGQGLQHENNHVLLLLNGRPFRESVASGLVASMLAGFPIDLIESIEIIRGPGSVLYGTSAFSGVINIKTKSADTLGNGSASTSYGSFNSFTLQGHGAAASEDWNVVAGARFMDSDGWDYSFTDQNGTSDSFKTADQDVAAVVVANYKDLTVNAFYGRTEQAALQPTGAYPVRLGAQANGMVDVGFLQRFGGDWNARYNLTYNEFDWTDIAIRSNDILGEVVVQGTAGDKVGLTFGTTYEDHDGTFEGTALQEFGHVSKQLYSLYGQVDFKLAGWMKVVGGLQYNNPRDLSSGFSPRFGVIGNFQTGWGFKLLHGEAFRSATFVERSIVAPGIIRGNPALAPEEIATSEAQLFYHQERFNVAVTRYHSAMTNLIRRVGFPIQFENSGRISFDGYEVEGKALLGKHVSFSGNFTYQDNEDEFGARNTTFTPSTMAKAGVTYDADTGFTLGLYDSYFGNPSQAREFFPGVPDVNPEASNYHLMTLNAVLDLNEIRKSSGSARWTVQMFVDNLLDQSIYFPDINAQRVNSFPIRPGRSVSGTVKVSF